MLMGLFKKFKLVFKYKWVNFLDPFNKMDSMMEKIKKIEDSIKYARDDIYNLNNELSYMKGLTESELKSRKKIILIGTPEHSNIGDAAITLGEIEFIRQFFSEYQLIELSKYDFESWHGRIFDLVGQDDIIFLQGGGNIGNRYILEERLRRMIISNFPTNKIIIFPQTVYFDDNAEGVDQQKISREIYNNHSKLILFTRGKESLDRSKKYFDKTYSAEMLDMALMLKFDFKNIKRHGMILCGRNLEDEGVLTKEDYEKILFEIDKMHLEFKCITTWYNDDPNQNIFKDMRRIVVYKKLEEFASSQVVITDRLHGLIFSILTNTPCIVFGTYNRKVDEFVEYFKDSNAIFYAQHDIFSVKKYIELALQIEKAEYPVLSQKMFSHMAEIIYDNGEKNEEIN